MPFIECHIEPGLTDARKRRLIREIVDVTHEAIGSDPKIINVVLHEHPPIHLSVSGRVEGDGSDEPRRTGLPETDQEVPPGSN